MRACDAGSGTLKGGLGGAIWRSRISQACARAASSAAERAARTGAGLYHGRAGPAPCFRGLWPCECIRRVPHRAVLQGVAHCLRRASHGRKQPLRARPLRRPFVFSRATTTQDAHTRGCTSCSTRRCAVSRRRGAQVTACAFYRLLVQVIA